MTTTPVPNNLTLEKLFPKGNNIVSNQTNNYYTYEIPNMDIKTSIVTIKIGGKFTGNAGSMYTVKNPSSFFTNVKKHLQRLKDFDVILTTLKSNDVEIKKAFFDILQFFTFSCSDNSPNLENYDPTKKSNIYIAGGDSINILSYLYYIYRLEKGESLLGDDGLPDPSTMNIVLPPDFKIEIDPQPDFIRNLCPLTVSTNTHIFKLLLLIIFMLIAYIVYKNNTK